MYGSLPDTGFESDPAGQKERWRLDLREKLTGMSEEEAAGRLGGIEARHPAYRGLPNAGEGARQVSFECGATAFPLSFIAVLLTARW